MLVYADASALVKLALTERESDAARRYLSGEVIVVVSRIGLVEATRAVGRYLETQDPIWEAILENLSISELDRSIADTAARIEPSSLRPLDAIHLATAVALRAELDAFVTYDARLAEAARTHRLPVVSPA